MLSPQMLQNIQKNIFAKVRGIFTFAVYNSIEPQFERGGSMCGKLKS